MKKKLADSVFFCSSIVSLGSLLGSLQSSSLGFEHIEHQEYDSNYNFNGNWLTILSIYKTMNLFSSHYLFCKTVEKTTSLQNLSKIFFSS